MPDIRGKKTAWSEIIFNVKISLCFCLCVKKKKPRDLYLIPPEAMQTVFMKYCWPNLGGRMRCCKRSHLQSCLVSTFASTPDLYRLQLRGVMPFGQLLSLELEPTFAE